MRATTFIGLTLAVTAITAGCTSDKHSKHADHAEKSATHTPAAASSLTLEHNGQDVLWLAAHPGTNHTNENDALHIRAHEGFFDIWLVNDAKTVDAAAALVPQVITSEFTGFTPTSTTNITIAGSPAKRIMGTGAEADDDDPGTADVVVFTAGGHVFVACAHGEHLPPSTQAFMMSTLATATATQPAAK